MKTISLKLVGTKPLMVHNPRVVDPFDKYKKLLQPLTSKRTKTDDDLLEICRLQFLASLYYRNGEYVLPQSHVEGSFQAAAKERKLGKKFERSFGLYGDGVLQFKDNDKTPEELFEVGRTKEGYFNPSTSYVDTRACGIKGSVKVPATRAIFPEWSTEVTCWFDETQLNEEEVLQVAEIAGLRYHVGTYRKLYGAFKVEKK